MNTKFVGDIGENIAVNYLKDKNFKILERNVKLCGVEVDIIAKTGTILVFCEVKTRYNVAFGRPVEAVDRNKQRRYITAAKYYVSTKRLKNQDVRFDVIEVLDDEIAHIEGAFTE